MKKKLIGLIGIMVAVLAFTSCSSTDSYYDLYSPLNGQWQLSTVNGIPVTEYETSVFTFYNDGTGLFGQYYTNAAGYPTWGVNPITYDVDFSDPTLNFLNVRTWNGQVWQYTFRVSYDTLVLYDLAYNNTLVYVYMGGV